MTTFTLNGKTYETDTETLEVLRGIMPSAKATGDSSAVIAVIELGLATKRIAELTLKALEGNMDGEEAPHPDVAAAYNVAYRIVHGEPEPERDEIELPF